MARTSDVIAAADWILKNKDRLNIRVANFSLHSSVPNSFMYDPLDKAVEKLWFANVVVVAAAGNFGVNGQPSTMGFAPGNDPFVITVGANDIDGSLSTWDDEAAPWSAYGYTLDGFAKPDIGAPGRYMIAPVPSTSTLAQGAARPGARQRLHRALGHLVRGAARLRHRGLHARAPSRVDARPGQGRDDADGEAHAERQAALPGSRRGQRAGRGGRRSPAEPERGADAGS